MRRRRTSFRSLGSAAALRDFDVAVGASHRGTPRAAPKPRTKGPSPKALPIEHWLLVIPPLAITSVVIEGCTQFAYDRGDDLWKCTIKLSAYRTPAPALGKVSGTAKTGTTNGVGTRHPDTAQDKADETTGVLWDQFNYELAGGRRPPRGGT